jgi:hypothetical protein
VAIVASFDPFDIAGTIVLGPVDPIDPADPSQEGTAALTGALDPDDLPTQTPNTSHIILGPVLVTNVQVEEGFQSSASLGGDDDEDGDDETPVAPTANLLVTVAIEAPAVERVVFAAEHGTVWLAHQPAGADLEGTSVQDRATVYLPTEDEGA